MRLVGRYCCVLLCLWAAFDASGQTPRFEFKDGDRVVFLGSGLFERDLRYGYIETFLTARFHTLKLTFRNLAWSGDTVFGDARAGFDTAAEGYQRMIKHVQDAKPTVIFLAFGQNESFDGEAGLPTFKEGLNALLAELNITGARVVLMTPPLLENLGPPLPDPSAQNENVRLYADVLKETATESGYHVVDLTRPLRRGNREPIAPYTDDGVHFTAYGYWNLAQEIITELGYVVLRFHAHGIQPFELSEEVFFSPPLPEDTPAKAREQEVHHLLRFFELPAGTLQLATAGGVIASATAEEWARGVQLLDVPEVKQVEELRKVIVEKNRLFFNQWRPQNETYIFGFRKYEQGEYAAEIPQFDPLIEVMEKQIDELKVPKLQTYRFEVGEGK